METLTKPEVIALMKDYSDTGLTNAKCKDAYECLCAAIRDSVKAGKIVRLEGIGNIVPVVKEAREIEDKLHGKGTISVPRHLSCKFKMSPAFKTTLRETKIPKDM